MEGPRGARTSRQPGRQYYAHRLAGSITVRPGDWVERGQIIGRVGMSGFTEGPHLHFSVYDEATTALPVCFVPRR